MTATMREMEDIEREAERWEEFAETMALSRYDKAQYARGRAAGLQQALEILGIEVLLPL
jgi:hypothetical protein